MLPPIFKNSAGNFATILLTKVHLITKVKLLDKNNKKLLVVLYYPSVWRGVHVKPQCTTQDDVAMRSLRFIADRR